MVTGLTTYRPLVGGVHHVVASGHQLAAAAAYRILESGGNAIDAGVASGLALDVVQPQYTSLGGVAPIILHHAERNETVTISGLGRWPKAASIELFQQRYNGEMPQGIPRTVTPAAADAWLTALKLYGTMSFEQVVTPALELADEGFRVSRVLHEDLTGFGNVETMLSWSATRETFFPDGHPLEAGKVLVQPDLANTS